MLRVRSGAPGASKGAFLDLIPCRLGDTKPIRDRRTEGDRPANRKIGHEPNGHTVDIGDDERPGIGRQGVCHDGTRCAGGCTRKSSGITTGSVVRVHTMLHLS